METLLFNMRGPAKPRYEVLEGKEYLVVPMVMITEGVFNGSSGPLYYSEEELAKTPSSWNHRPIVSYHPVDGNGNNISACDPAVINARKVGLILNTFWNTQDKKLRAEAWLDKVKLSQLDPRVLEAVARGELVEISTGLFTDNEAKEGEFNGRKYTAVAKNYRPDHLAILYDQKGACSVADGAGLLANADQPTSAIDNQRKQAVVINAEERAARVDKMVGKMGVKEGHRKTLMEMDESTLTTFEEMLADAEPSNTNINKLMASGGGSGIGGDSTANVPGFNQQGGTQLTLEQYLATMPPQMQELVRNGLEAHTAEKSRLIGIILNTANCPFKKEYLDKRSLDELTGIAALASAAQAQQSQSSSVLNNGFRPNFTGAAGATPVVVNQEVETEPLPLPNYNNW